MKKIIPFLVSLVCLSHLSFATLTAKYVPVTKTGGGTPVLQNGSITDTGTSSGVGNVGIGTATPTSTLEIRQPNFFDKVYDFNGVSTYTDITTEAKTTFGTAKSFLSNADATHYLMVEKTSAPFQDITIGLKTYATATNAMLATYWNGSAWTSLSVTDGTNNFQNSGTITYTIPGDWATTAVNSVTGYWIRIGLTASTSTPPSMYFAHPGSSSQSNLFNSINDTTGTLSVSPKGQVLTNGVPVVSPTTYTVGLTSSRYGSQADFVCSGAKDQVCINKAIAACGSNPCKIILLEGTYNITGSIGYDGNASLTPLINNLEIAGMGEGKTIIKGNGGFGSIEDTHDFSSGAPLTNFSVHDLEIDRTGDTKDGTVSKKAIFIQYLKNVNLYNIYAHDAGATCIGIDFLNGAHIVNNIIDNCGTSSASTGSSGIGIGTDIYSTEPDIIEGNIITASGYGGILIENQGSGDSSNFILANNILTGGSQYGIIDTASDNLVITGNLIRSNTKDGIILKSTGSRHCDNVTISGNIINSNTGWGVNITDTLATNVQVNNNDMTNNTSGTVSNSSTNSILARLNNLGDTGVNWSNLTGIISGQNVNWSDVKAYGSSFGGDHSNINWTAFGV